MECDDCTFYHHPSFEKELDSFIEHHCGSQQTNSATTIEYAEKGLYNHLFKKSVSFTAKHFGRAEGYGALSVYWMHLVVPNSGISKTQQPKAYLLKMQNMISFLCLDSHLQNYKDSKLRAIASIRIEELFEMVKKQ